MPSGRTHDRITLWSLPFVVGLAWAISRSSAIVLIVCAGFLFGGLMLGPDLDIHSVHYKRWGWLRWIWLPYRGSMRHRSPLSHAPIVGTLVRVVYLGVWVGVTAIVAMAIANEIGQFGWTWAELTARIGRSLRHYRSEWLAAAIGLELGALSHYLADWGTSTHKRWRTRGWRAFLPRDRASRRSNSRHRSKPRSKL